jgi:hypothetical protein
MNLDGVKTSLSGSPSRLAVETDETLYLSFL